MSDHEILTFGRVVAENQLIWLRCATCPREMEIRARALLPGIPHEMPFPKIRKCLKCSRCGGKQIDVMPEIYAGGFIGNRARGEEGPTRALVKVKQAPASERTPIARASSLRHSLPLRIPGRERRQRRNGQV